MNGRCSDDRDRAVTEAHPQPEPSTRGQCQALGGQSANLRPFARLFVVSNIYTTICYFIYERIWVRITWGKIELEPVAMGARRRGVRSTVARTRKFLRHAMLHKPKDKQP
jgi:hypothetical protein